MKYVDVYKTKEASKEPKKFGSKLYPAIALGVLALLVVGFFVTKGHVKPISIIANATIIDLKETDGRTNILLLGSDKRSFGEMSENATLTDTILVASIGKFDKDVVLISIPRDLWVDLPSGGQEKINAVYAFEGVDGTKKVIEEVLGIPIHYHALVTFDLFRESIDALGGIDVEVANSFTDYQYPIEGKETAPENERYEVITFQKGVQHMDGNTALKFARSRKGDNNEGTDFARAKRQQAVIAAIKQKAMSLPTLLNLQKINDLYSAYAKNVETNLSITDIGNFYLLSQQINIDKLISIVLDDRSSPDEGGLLYSPVDKTLYGGRYVLIPQTGDYSQIHAYVQKYLFGNK